MTESSKYQAPRLERFGQLSNLTAGGSAGVPEVNQTNGMDQDQQRL